MNAEKPGAVHSNSDGLSLEGSVKRFGAHVSTVSRKTPSQPSPRPWDVVRTSRKPATPSGPSSVDSLRTSNQAGSPAFTNAPPKLRLRSGLPFMSLSSRYQDAYPPPPGDGRPAGSTPSSGPPSGRGPRGSTRGPAPFPRNRGSAANSASVRRRVRRSSPTETYPSTSTSSEGSLGSDPCWRDRMRSRDAHSREGYTITRACRRATASASALQGP